MKRFFFLVALFYGFVSLSGQSLYFPPIQDDTWETIDPASLGWCTEEIENLYTFLDDSNSKSFVLLKDGKIVLEKYFDGFTQDSVWYWASAGKTITSFLVGIAQEDGMLDINNKTSDYLGEGWTSMDAEKEELITVRHQLTMTTGMDETLGECIDPSCLDYKVDAGTRWFYHNSPYTILRNVIEEASGQNYNIYTYQNLLSKTGMSGLWIWTGFNNLFFSTARSMARFGLLNLADGNWDGSSVLGDMEYINAMRNTSKDLNKYYGYLYWLNGKESHHLPGLDFEFNGAINENGPPDMYSGIGKNGQSVDIIPSQNLVCVRMGDNPDNSLVPVNFHREMWEKISAILCTSSNENTNITHATSVTPNPFSDELLIETDNKDFILTMYDQLGKEVLQSREHVIYTGHISAGIYFIKIREGNKIISTQKVIKN